MAGLPECCALYGQDTMLIARLKEHVSFLASMKLEGRGSGTEGQKEAARYIERQFMEAGLSPAGDSGYFQPFTLYKIYPPKVRMERSGKVTESWFIGGNNSPWPDQLEMKYAGDRQLTQWTGDAYVSALVLVPKNPEQARDLITHYASRGFRHFILLISKSGMYRSQVQYSNRLGSWKLANQPPKHRLETMLREVTFPWNAVLMYESDFMRITGTSAAVREAWDQTLKQHKSIISIPDVFQSRVLYPETKLLLTENVAAKVEGKARPEEYIIVTAHYDHVGKEDQKIHPGADDNASGTAALIELASAIASDARKGNPPECTILFVAFSAEELGLLGSEYFVNRPGFPRSSTLLNINLDMIGRSDKYGMIRAMAGNMTDQPKYREAGKSGVYVLHKGKEARKGLKESKIAAKGAKGFRIDRTPGLLTRITYKFSSDHKHFADAGIPILVYFTGLHPDYHTPRDTWDKLDYGNMATITRVILQTLKTCSNL
ncbi:MAG TPA: M28 family peptidase [Bacteroidales bacterium]|nr:M28 family peptidase [Bacteroidales bacterium]